MKGFTDADVPDQSGRCFVVSGANTGIGFETARVLASKGARVLLGCRDRIKAEAALRRIGQEVPGADIAYLPLDLADLASVAQAAELVGRELRVDVLVNNAGVMASSMASTKQGFEQHFGVNHLGTFALTLLLLPQLAETAGARVVITSSLVHSKGDIDFANLETGKGYKPNKLYAHSKLANLLFLFELDRRLREAGSGVTAVGCHPGFAATELMRDMPGWVHRFAPLLGKFVNDALAGSWPTLQAACAPDIQPGGYYGPQGLGGVRGPAGPASRSRQARNAEVAVRLWARSEELAGIRFDRSAVVSARHA